MKFVKLTRFYSEDNASIYINMALVETIVDKTDDGKVVGSIIGMVSMQSDDAGIVVKETYSEIMNLLYWEEINGQAEKN